MDCGSEYACTNVPSEGPRCVKTTPGCNTDADCILGFSCEGEEGAKSCVDRRVPCEFDEDCPMSHSCVFTGNGEMCVRVHKTCSSEFNCAKIAPRCEDIDGDTIKECAGVFDPNIPDPVACVNAACTNPSAPVCEVSGQGSVTQCGQYGLCLGDGDCDTVNGFICVGLWSDGRKECVPNGGDCASTSECPIQQVCASPREGGVPTCQAGSDA
jgi:hypothetical protein